MGKYDPIRDHLQGLDANSWQASFADVEKVIGTKLPPSAYKYPAWWANERSPSAPQRGAWLEAEWKTSELNLTAREIRFVKS